ncbi:hypothetical protein I6B53_09215 [Schaalia sp. 19OD2882]|uniref:CshA/CshB family fibrillar adhesin-related protein n=1 Tax=Schaalia sp. 19OD2882 TaxID=2794089 RepID=UPI001C1E998C|nr:CshA/CshB family fibrillar adhesin-related protein [Schaalia sp. 19OD2882]QWW19267.1 hypothetical protein I6B53_09215 [Schaalia sp. 19OD2882]
MPSTPQGRRRRSHGRLSALVLSAGIVHGIVLGTLLAVTPVQPARAVHGTPDGGAGKYETVIDWIDWSGASNLSGNRLHDGVTSTVWSTPTAMATGLWRSSKCTVSEVSTTYVDPATGATVNAGLTLGYVPGTWRGDGLARLYNNSVNYDNGVRSTGSYSSGLPIGIANAQRGVNDVSANAYFKVQCDTYVIESPARPTKAALDNLPKTLLPMAGMVYADAEASNWLGRSSVRESVSMAPIPMDGRSDDEVRFRLLESFREGTCTTNSWGGEYTFPYPGGDKTGFQLRPDKEECAYGGTVNGGPSSVLFMENADGGYVELKGGGVSAIALGVVSYVDFGDAPDSYGHAGSVFQPSWDGGELGGAGALDVSASTPPREAVGNWYNLSAAQARQLVATASAPKIGLGRYTDHDSVQNPTPGADGDDLSGSDGPGSPTADDDEDALEGLDATIRTLPGLTWSQNVSCHGEGAQVVGWIDWNLNGTFDDDTERSQPTTCPSSGRANLQWTVPMDARRSDDPATSTVENTFLRLRIAGANRDGTPADIRPTGLTLSGEVEDHAIETILVPTIQLVKKVDDTYSSQEVPSLPPEAWKLTAEWTDHQGVSKQVTHEGTWADQALLALPANSKTITIKERTDLPVAQHGYEMGQWTCTQSEDARPGDVFSTTVAPTVDGTATVTVGQGDRITCEVTNTTKPGTLEWGKKDALTGVAVGGSEWSLTGPDVPAGAVVADCVNAPCPTGAYSDGDPAPGSFTVRDLKWGTYSIVEKTAPLGYLHDPTVHEFPQINALNLVVSLPRGGAVDDGGKIANVRLDTGTVRWRKVDADNGEALAGSEWSLIIAGIPVPPATTAPSTTVTVTDCTTDPCAPATPAAPHVDQDPAAGAFMVSGLVWNEKPNSFSLVESKAPVGYVMDATPHTFTISKDAPEHSFPNSFTNAKVPVPGLPLTGGASSDLYIFLGFSVSLLAIVAAVIAQRMRQRIGS